MEGVWTPQTPPLATPLVISIYQNSRSQDKQTDRDTVCLASFQIVDRIRRQSSWASYEFMYTPPTPTRRDSTVSSRRRCALGLYTRIFMLEVGKRRRTWIGLLYGLQLNALLPRWSVSIAEFLVTITLVMWTNFTNSFNVVFSDELHKSYNEIFHPTSNLLPQYLAKIECSSFIARITYHICRAPHRAASRNRN